MPINILSWNINNFSAKKKQSELFDYISEVFDTNEIQFMGLIEVQSFMGDTFGQEIGGRINYGNTIRFQDSDQFVAHSEQYLAFWNINNFANTAIYDNFSPLEFPNVNERPPAIYMMNVTDGTTVLNNVPFALYHSPGPGKGATVVNGCNNISKIPQVATATYGVIMGDFNINPSTPNNGTRAQQAFGNIIGLGYQMELAGVKTSLKTKSSVSSSASSLNDCLASEYDHFFVKLPPGTTFSAKPIDTITTAVVGSPTYNAAYAYHLGSWQAQKLGYPAGYTITYTTIKQAFDAYRDCVSDHLPIMLTIG